MKMKTPPILTATTPEFVSWFEKRKAAYIKYMTANFPAQLKEGAVSFEEGSRYIRVFVNTATDTFIDKMNGDVLKPATWRAPAKGARGNIFDQWNGMKFIDPHTGPAYIRDMA